jgi:hypothetical protein
MVSTITHAEYPHQYADYLAIVISERRKAVLGHELTSEENSTRGMPVEGLTARMLPSSMRSKAMHESDRSYRAEVPSTYFPDIDRNTTACRYSCTVCQWDLDPGKSNMGQK